MYLHIAIFKQAETVTRIVFFRRLRLSEQLEFFRGFCHGSFGFLAFPLYSCIAPCCAVRFSKKFAGKARNAKSVDRLHWLVRLE